MEALAISQDNATVAAAVFRQSAAYLWNHVTGEQIAKLPHRNVYGLDFSSTGKVLTTVGWDNFIRRWDAATGQQISEWDVREVIPKDENQNVDLRMYGVTNSPDGNHFATAHMGGRIGIWKFDSDQQVTLSTLVRSNSFVYGAIAYSPDGLWLAAGGGNGDVSLYEAATGRDMFNVGHQHDYIFTVDFVGNGGQLVSGAGSESYLWNLEPKGLFDGAAFEQTWQQLDHENGEIVYRAIRGLARLPDITTVDLIVKRLEKVETVLDFAAITRDLPKAEADRRIQLSRQALGKDSKKESLSRIRRAITVLRLIDNEVSRKELKILAQQHPLQVVRDLAASP